MLWAFPRTTMVKTNEDGSRVYPGVIIFLNDVEMIFSYGWTILFFLICNLFHGHRFIFG